jgi:hypothetical protein
MPDQQTRPTGATPARARSRRPLWLWVLLALVVIVLLVLFLVRCGSGSGSGSDQGATGGAAVPSASAAPASGAAGAPASGDATSSSGAPGGAAGTGGAAGSGGAAGTGGTAGAGTVTAGDAALLPLAGAVGANGELTALVGRTATGKSVAVRSVPSDEGFWVGSSDTDRVWVELTVPAGESPYQVTPGQLVDFTGPVTAHDAGFAGQVGVDAAEGADQLTKEAAHVSVQKADLRIVQG